MNAKLKRQEKRQPGPRGDGITVSTYLYPEIYKQLVDAAGLDGRSVSNIVAICITAHLPKFVAGLKKRAKG